MTKAAELIGQPFGRLTVVERAPSKNGKACWRCECECGGSVVVATCTLNAELTQSCGCLRRELTGERHSTHGRSRTPEHYSWLGMKSRCYNPRSKQFKDYGGRGIKVCDEWRASFEAFLEHMGPKPSPEHEIDRVDNDGNYEPGNCRWATKVENNNNRRTNVRITAFGETKTVSQWARDPRCRVSDGGLRYRLTELGLDHEHAIAEPQSYLRISTCKRSRRERDITS